MDSVMRAIREHLNGHGPAWLLVIVAVLLAPAALAGTQTTQPPLKHMTVDLSDTAALRTGALYFMHRCSACHSMQGMRLNELQRPLGLDGKQIQQYLNTSDRRILETMVSSMPQSVAKKFLNTSPPDLTVMAKARSVDWLYTYLTSFYLDPSRPTGVNNVAFHNVAMPDVFADLQGLQSPIEKMGWRYGNRTKVAVGVQQATQGTMSPQDFDTAARDIVSFLYYTAHPHETTRHAIGAWVLGLLGALTVLSYLLYRVYWRRVIPPQGGRWWSYWKGDA